LLSITLQNALTGARDQRSESQMNYKQAEKSRQML